MKYAKGPNLGKQKSGEKVENTFSKMRAESEEDPN
jgi:hypothetical protein